MLRDADLLLLLLLLNADALGGDTAGDAKGEIPPLPSSLVGGLLVLVVASSAADPTTEEGAVDVFSEDSEGLDDAADHGSLGRMVGRDETCR